jgi:Raf kinase inhibitor-like YbhB/YbcL family protein
VAALFETKPRLAVLILLLIAMTSASQAAETTKKSDITLTSPAFAEGGAIPEQYTCQGKNTSPPLKWSAMPSEARSLALIVDDPDAPSGTWVHWVLYDLPPSTIALPENVAKSQYIPGGAKQGLNDFKHLGFGGPCPPAGKPHRYFFKLYALDKVLDLKPGATKKDVERAMEKHIISQGQLIGTYKRK